ncbi:MAG TPA: TetR family transcriptional regulator C-terminal domain-containing protein [Methylomirabilota bacterium]
MLAASAAPKGSLYHYFPGGKQELTTAALKEAERGVSEGLRGVFHKPVPLADKVSALFAGAARNLETNQFTRGCPVAAVTLDIDRDSEDLRAVCRAIFDSWQAIIADGLDEIPKAERRGVARLIFATFEGTLILARAEASKEPLLNAGRTLADILGRRFAAPRRSPRARRGRHA